VGIKRKNNVLSRYQAKNIGHWVRSRARREDDVSEYVEADDENCEASRRLRSANDIGKPS